MVQFVELNMIFFFGIRCYPLHEHSFSFTDGFLKEDDSDVIVQDRSTINGIHAKIMLYD